MMDCPGCGAPDGYPSAGPCLDHGTMTAVADVPGITSCIDCGRRLTRRRECPVCEDLRSPDQQLTELMDLLNLAINSRLMDRESKVLEVDRLAGLYKAAVAEWVSTEEDRPWSAGVCGFDG